MSIENREVFGVDRPTSSSQRPRGRRAAGSHRVGSGGALTGSHVAKGPSARAMAMALAALATALGGCTTPLFPKPQPAPSAQAPQDAWNSGAPAADDRDKADVMAEVDRYLASLREAPAAGEAPSSATSSASTPSAAVVLDRAKSRPPAEAASRERDVTLANAALEAEPSDVDHLQSAEGGASLHQPPAPPPPVLMALSVEEEPPSPQRSVRPTSGVANLPAEALPDEDQLSVAEYARALREGRLSLDPVETAWRSRLLEVVLGQAGGEPSRVDRLSPAQQEVFDASLDTARAVRRVLRDPVASANGALEHARRLNIALAQMADLLIPRSALCSRVMTFGVYETMAFDRFVAGRTNQTILYCEVENFVSREENGEFRSLFSSRVELLTATGESVWKQEEASIEDHCTRQRTDFFIAQRLSLPPTLPAGNYVLKLTLEDRLAGKVNETTLPLTLKSPASLAGGLEP